MTIVRNDLWQNDNKREQTKIMYNTRLLAPKHVSEQAKQYQKGIRYKQAPISCKLSVYKFNRTQPLGVMPRALAVS